MKAVSKLTLILALVAPLEALAKNYCGELANHYGPLDYRKGPFDIVERAHFTEEVEKLVKGSTGSLGGDIDYTLRAIPNHARALASLAKLGLRKKGERIEGLKWSVECYFDRAMRFQPDDAAVRSVYGSYLYKLGRSGEAIEQLTEAIRLDPENGTANYNLGLIYFEKKNYEKAAVYAKRAEAIGFPILGLKNKLVAKGMWNAEAKS
jgi:tetratricopeptide (TPR) repeat protein